MEIYKPFSVLVVPFPFTDSKHTKKRPALVICSQKYQRMTHHVTLVMITSAKHSHWETDYEIKDLGTTGLTAKSIIRQKIFTLDSRLIIRKAGELSNFDKESIIRKLKIHLCF